MLQMDYYCPNHVCSQSLTPVEGLYLSGASAYTSGIIHGGGGYICANTIADDFGVKKTWDEIECVKQARENGFIQD